MNNEWMRKARANMDWAVSARRVNDNRTADQREAVARDFVAKAVAQMEEEAK